MTLRKISAVIAAALALTVIAPSTGAFPTIGTAVSAATTDPASVLDLNVGDIFYAVFDPNTGAVVGEPTTDVYEAAGSEYAAYYKCIVLSDSTINITTESVGNKYAHEGCRITIPEKIGNYTVTEIRKAREGGFSSITVPDTVTKINQAAFNGDILLEEVHFGENSQLKFIDKWGFCDCRSLKSITIPASVETIAYGAFGNTDDSLVGGFNNDKDLTNTYSLTSVKFVEGSKLKTLDEYAFYEQRSLADVELPEGLTVIEECTFGRCTALKSIKLPTSITVVGDSAFSKSGLTSIELNEGLKEIERGAFFDCLDLKSVTLPASVETVGKCAFALTRDTVFDKTSSMTEINVDPDNKNFKSVDGVLYTADGKELVACPPGKAEVKFADGVTEIQQGAFQGCNQITSVTIPDTITKLPIDAFSMCIKLNEAVLPETLTEIGQWAFQYTALTDITIPESVTVIDPQAFEDSLLKNINGVEGSYAETFAKENGYTFNSVSSETNTFTDESDDKAADIEVIAKPDVIPKQAHFSVRLDEENSTETRIAYNCYFTYNGEEYEPTDTVTVRIPIPVAMLDIADTLKVYHLQDGKYVKMNVRVEDGYLVFETDHFSTYVVTADEIEENGGSSSGSTDTSDSSENTTAPSGSDDSGNTDNSGEKDNPNTGVVGITTTAAIAAAAAAAIVIYRKRK